MSELLMSNLPVDEFSCEELKELYHLRWTIETSYNHLKNRMKLEEFSGNSTTLVLQDIYADVLLYNLVALNIIEANYKRPVDQANGKYTIKRNFNKSLGIMKRYLFKAIENYKDKEKYKEYMLEIDRNIEENLVWVEKSRTCERQTSINKDSRSYKNAY